MGKIRIIYSYTAVAIKIWSFVWSLAGISWSMPRLVADLLSCWMGQFGKHQFCGIWKAVLLFVMWWLQRDRNVRTFEDVESSMLKLKALICASLV